MEIKKVLCAVDFSEGAREALRVASELARKWQAVLVLAHVVEQPLWVREPYLHLPGDQRRELIAAAEAELTAWRDEARRLGAPEVVTKMPSGAAWDRLVTLAREDPAIGMIVTGTHGRTGVSRTLIGSVAERVVRHAPCSVLVVRPPSA